MPAVSKRDEQIHAGHPCALPPIKSLSHPIMHILPLFDSNKLLDAVDPSRVWHFGAYQTMPDTLLDVQGNIG